MGWFSKSNNSGSSAGDVSTDGRGGFTSVSNGGVATSTGGDPVDNLIAMARDFADQDGDD